MYVNFNHFLIGALYPLFSETDRGEASIKYLHKQLIQSYKHNSQMLYTDSYLGCTIYLTEFKGQQVIIIKAYIYAANPSKAANRLVDAAIEFWNAQSGKFAYKFKIGNREITLPVFFQLVEAPGMYNEGGLFIPSNDISYRLTTFIQILPHEQIRLLDSEPHTHTVGYTTSQGIYISEKYAHNDQIGIHEVGHKIGARHSGQSIMASEVHALKMKVKKRTLKDILSRGGLPVKGRSRRKPFVSSFTDTFFADDPKIPSIKGKIIKNKEPLHHHQLIKVWGK